MKLNLRRACNLILAIILSSGCSSAAFAQLTGIKYIPGDYATLSAGITALNASGVGAGGVTFNIPAGYTETITTTLSVTATGTLANPVLFQKDPGTTGANPLITAYTGGTGTPGTAVQDGIWRLVGSDYVTIDGIDVRDNPSNTSNPSTMEYGYALYKASTSNGCQFVTIQHCVITLNNINNAAGTAPMVDGSTGVIIMNALPTAAVTVVSPVAGGTNSNNKLYGNTIQNCNIGIGMIGYTATAPFTLADANNDVGGSSVSTGNTILNYGGAPGATVAAAAIRTTAQYGLNVSYNTVNSNNGAGANHAATLRGIYINSAASANATITYNTITVKGGGTTQTVAGIENAAGSTPAGNTVNISNNSITNCTYTTATTGTFYGIYNVAAPASVTINNNTISNNAFSATSGTLQCIFNSGAASIVAMNGNTVSGNSTSASTTGSFYGIRNSAATPHLEINSNTLFGNFTSSASGAHYPINNQGAVTTSITMDSNNIGTGVSPAVTFNAANSTSQIFIYNAAGGAGAALSISNNNFQGITYAIAGSGGNTYISNIAATLSQAINGNTFTNLDVNTTGSIVFIANSVIVPAAGTQNVNNNAISGTFVKTGIGGAVTLFTSTVASVTNSVINNNNNNFSNITVAGSTTIAGWVNTDAGGSTKTIQNNIFSNWTGGTGVISGMAVNLTGANNSTTGNTINNITSGGSIYGITTAAGNDKIYSNTIHTLISSGSTGTVSGIYVTLGTIKNIYQNTIYNLQGNSITTGTVRGILVAGGTTVNVYLNTIYSLQANSLTTGTLNGIWVLGGTTITVYRNKIYDLSSSSSAFTTVGSATGAVNGILVSGATANLNTTIRNNLIGDLRTPSASFTDPVRGISLISTGSTSNIYVYHNTIYLNAVSGGANFGSSGIYHTTSTTATTAALDLRNNIIINTSVPKGTGLTVAYRRSSATLTNYALTSNNNLFYAGLGAANRLLYYNGTNPDQFLSTYKARVSPRDAESVTEDMISTSKFISTTGSSASFLHLDPAKASQAESGAVNIAGVTIDFDGETRQGNAGYAGTGAAPDIGADEADAIPSPALSGIYNVGAGQTFTSLTNAGGLFASINSVGLSGNVVVNITSDLTEDGTNVLYQWVEQGIGNYSVTIQPNSSTVRTISGDVLAGMIRLNGAKRLIIDGSNGTAGRYLTFRNTNTTGTTGTAFTFINGATNNTIKYCTIEAFANTLNGVILFSTSTVAEGNSNNTINNCSINATVNGNTGNTCIYSAGTTGKENSTNIISNNNIYDYRDRALDIASTGSKSWMISNNSCYNGGVSGSVSYAASTTLHGIRILGGAGYTLSKNYIGGSAALATGSSATYSSTGILSFQGILLTTSSATPASAITGNTVANISISAVPTSTSALTVFIGIETNGSGIHIGGSLVGDGNTIGSNTTNGSIAITTTTTATNLISTIKGINCLSTGGFITGNQVGGIDIKNIGAGPAPSSFFGIYINTATAPSPVNNNIIGSTGTGAASNSIRVLSTSTANATLLTGIYTSSTVVSSVQVSGNIIKNISHQSPTASGSFTGIGNTATGAAVVVITNNTISGNTNNATAGLFYGIFNNNASPSTLTVTSNTISDNTSTATGLGLFYGVLATGLSPSITMNNNTFSGNITAALTTGKFVGFYNASNAASLTINSNTLYGNATTATSGIFYGIYNSGAVTAVININSNNIGTSSSSAITYNAANSGGQIFINNLGGASTAALSISNNNFQTINYAVAGTGSNTYISNTAPTFSQAINGNTFTNMNVNTGGAIVFISDNVIVPVNGSQNVNNNSIVGGFTKAASGSVTLFSSTVTSAAGSMINNNSNNFSNITVTSGTPIIGWVNTDAGSSTKNVQNNTFSNWIGGTGTITALTVNIAGTANNTTGNLISNISGIGIITGMATATGNNNIYSNTIDSLSTTGSSAVTAIAVSGGTTQNIYKNKIFDISGSNTGSTANGILVSGGIAINVYNNFIGNLRTPAANLADAIRGISVTSAIASSAINVYYNTVYLNASSTGTTFGTSGIYHVVNATATTAALNLRNNSITNTSTPKGTGLTVAYRRTGIALSNYAATSNNNLFYGGTPGASKLIFTDGTNSDQTLTAYKTRVSTRDAVSVSEDLTSKFLSTAGSSPVFLHMSTAIASAVESGASNITGFTDDFDGQIRAGNPGYIGSSSSPDIGADEIFGIETTAPAITYTALTNTTATTNPSVTGVAITDASGVNIAAGTKPRLYYKRSSDANVWLDNSPGTNGWKYTEASNSSSPFTFTIDYSLLNGGATGTAGVIQYFMVAQDIATTANIAINSGTFASPPSSVALTASAFPISGAINSYNIPFSGNYNVGTGEIFTSLTKADGLFASINSAGLMGNLVVNITSDLTEDGVNALNQWTESGVGNYTLTIQPNASVQRTISGNAPGGLIRLDGADRLTINGSNSGSGNYLSFKNTNTAGTTGTAFTFTNGATNNTLRNIDAEASGNATNGVILFGTSALAGGNSNNLIDSCTINATVAANTGYVAVYAAGTVGNENAANTLSNNSIYGYRDRGVDISATGSTAWLISGNSFYNGDVTGAVNYAASSTLHGIRVLGGSGYEILNNYIGGDENFAAGANAVYASSLGDLSFQGILLTTTAASPASSIKGNTIASISIFSVPTAANSTAFTGIETNGSGITIGGSSAADGNMIGSATSNGSVIINTSTTAAANTSMITGINFASSGGVVNYNHIGGFDISNTGAAPAASTVRGIYISNPAAPAQVNHNLIGSATTANSISFLAGSGSVTPSLTGIEIGTAVNSALQINANSIQNMSNLSTVSSGSFTGIKNTTTLSGAIMTISTDTVQYINTAINSNAGSTVYAGIISGSASTITTNTLSSFTLLADGSNAQIAGIQVSGPYAHTLSDNVVSNLSTASTKAMANAETGNPDGSAIIGILNTATASGQVISGNTIAALTTTSAAGVNVVITGIGINSSGSGSVFKNKMGTSTNNATGTGPALRAFMIADGSFTVYNNSIRVSNLAFTSGLKIYGIIHASGANCTYFHNSVRVGGNSVGIALRASAFIATGNGPFVLKDNVLVNIRTGTGPNYAVSNLAPVLGTWSAATSDYNALYSINAATTGEWGAATNKTFTTWQSTSGGDAHSVSNVVSFATSVNDLVPDSLTNCALDGAGTPITTPIVINTDLLGVARSVSNPDIGAYEFSYTLFTVVASNSSPICSGSTVDLAVDPGTAVNPTYSWKSPSGTEVSTLQNPTVTSSAGVFIVTVTDANGCLVTANTTVTLNQRPSASITGSASICEGGSVSLVLAVSGTGTLNGTMSDGTPFSGTAPSITVLVSPVVTTAFYIADLSDASCTAIRADIPDTLHIVVTHAGGWLGTISSNWNDAANWCGGVPTSATSVAIPGGLSFYPLLTSGTYVTGDLTVEAGGTLTVTGAVLQIGGDILNSGTFTASSGTIELNGAAPQMIPALTFAGNAIKNLTINNSSGVTLNGALNLTGVLLPGSGAFNANGNLTLVSSATQTALIDGSGAGSVTGNVTMQRYLAAGYGYKYFSSPFQTATVSNFSGTVDLVGPFANFYTYIENQATTGFTAYTTGTNLLNPLQGYAADFGPVNTPKTISITGVVTSGAVSATLFNHNQPYTQGFNLVGNPYPSPIDWNASSGWTKTNMDDAVYFFDSGTTSQYTGTYSTYINGVSSDGIAGNIIASMQGFFVHVTNGTYPVTGTLAVTNNVRVNNLSPVFHKSTFSLSAALPRTLLRLSANFSDNQLSSDPSVVYTNALATSAFNKELDAIKLMNTNELVPNLYVMDAHASKLAINALLNLDTLTVIPLGLQISKDGLVTFNLRDLEQWPNHLNLYFNDAETGINQDLQQNTIYTISLKAGTYESRFSLRCKPSTKINPAVNKGDVYYVYKSNGAMYMHIKLVDEQKGTLMVSNMMGQIISRKAINGNGDYELEGRMMSNAIYVAGFVTAHGVYAKKFFW